MEIIQKYWYKFLLEFKQKLQNAFCVSISISEDVSISKMQSLDERYNIFRTKCLITPLTKIDITITERKYDGYYMTSWEIPCTTKHSDKVGNIHRKYVPEYSVETIQCLQQIDISQIDKFLLSNTLQQVYTGIDREDPVILLGNIESIANALSSLLPSEYFLSRYGSIYYVTKYQDLLIRENIKEYLYGPSIILHLLKNSITPIIVDDGLLDIMMLYHNMIDDLPSDRLTFINLLHRLFPRIIDVRYLVSKGYSLSERYMNQIHSLNRRYNESNSFNTSMLYINLILNGIGIEENVMYSPFCNGLWKLQ